MRKILNPLNNEMEPIQSVLYALAGQEGCDGDPYDQVQEAAEYINELEGVIDNIAKVLCNGADI